MAAAVAGGEPPAACRGCFIAESIAIREGKRPAARPVEVVA
jgi:hypothetical protein